MPAGIQKLFHTIRVTGLHLLKARCVAGLHDSWPRKRLDMMAGNFSVEHENTLPTSVEISADEADTLLNGSAAISAIVYRKPASPGIKRFHRD